MADTWGTDSSDNPRAGDTPGFGSGGGGSVGGGGGYGSNSDNSGPASGGYSGGAGGGDGPFGGGGGGTRSWESQGRGSNVTSERPQSPVDSAAMSQGRGSNVTSDHFRSPVEMAAGVGPGGAVNAAGPSPTIPVGLHEYNYAPTIPGLPLFSLPGPMSVQTIGVPTINLNLPNSPVAGAFVGQNVRNFMNPSVGIGTNYYGNTGQVSQYSQHLGYSGQEAGFSQPLTAQVRQDYLSWLERESGLPKDSLAKQHAMEVGSTENPDTAVSSTGALGPFQFTRGTAKSLGLINPLTGVDARTDFIQSADAAAQLNVRNAQGLASFLGRQPTAAEVSIAYQQGLGGAKALIGNPNMSAKDALTKAYGGDADAAERAIKVNGGDPNAPASQFVGKLSSAFNAMPSDLTKLAAYKSEQPSDIYEAGTPFTGKTYTYDTMPKGPVVAGGGDQAMAEAATRAAAQGGQQTAAQAASSSPQSFGDWLDGIFGTPDRIKQLEAQGRTSTYFGQNAEETKQAYADEFTGGDVSKVQSRIVDFGQGPVVDYYAKGLGTALGEAFTAPLNAVGNLFKSSDQKPIPPADIPASSAASQNPNNFGSWLDSIFGSTPDRIKQLEAQGRTATYAGEDPAAIKQRYADEYTGGDVSKVQSRIVDFGQGPVVDYYAKGLDQVIGDVVTGPFKALGNLFGGSDASSSGIKTLSEQQSNTDYNPNNLRPPADVPKKENKAPPEEPDYTTGMDLTPSVYSGNPLVAYNYDLLRRGLIT